MEPSAEADFVFDRERNVYICPGGAELTSTGNIDQGHIVYYRANKNDYSVCSLKPCTTAVVRKVTRDIDEECATASARLPTRKPSSSHAASARRWRCDLRI
jgi:hypothetical protein